MNLTEKEKAYVAGVIDSRGSLILWKPSTFKYKFPVLRVSVVKSRWDLLEKLKEYYGGSISNYSDNRRSWVIMSKKLIKLLNDVLPYIKTGRRRKQITFLCKEWKPNQGRPTNVSAVRHEKEKFKFEKKWLILTNKVNENK